jgi:hypothetical protein
MSTDTQHNTIRTSELWLSLASGPLLWAAYHALVYAISSLACQRGFWISPVVGPISTLTLVLLGITVLVLLLMAFAGVRAFANWKVLRDDHQAGSIQPERTRSGFMAFSAIVLNILFGAATLITFLPSLYFDPCS